MLRIVLLIGALACGTGCTTGYWIDRGRDAADVFTFAASPAIGVRARFGPISSGLALHDTPSWGLAGGKVGVLEHHESKYGTDFPCFELLLFGYEEFRPRGIPKERDKGYSSYMLFMVNAEEMDHRVVIPPFWTQIEITAGLFVGGKVGFNPGELLDFILGFAGIDIYDDDLERRKEKEKEAEEAIPDPAKAPPSPR